MNLLRGSNSIRVSYHAAASIPVLGPGEMLLAVSAVVQPSLTTDSVCAQKREAAILALTGSTWMTSESWSPKWRPFISPRGLWLQSVFDSHQLHFHDPIRNHLFLLPPCSDSGGTTGRSISDPGLHSTSLSPQSVSSGGDSGVDSYCDHMSDFPSVTVSLCGGLSDNREITKGRLYFKRHLQPQRVCSEAAQRCLRFLAPCRALPRESHHLPAVFGKPGHHRRPQLGGANRLQVSVA